MTPSARKSHTHCSRSEKQSSSSSTRICIFLKTENLLELYNIIIGINESEKPQKPFTITYTEKLNLLFYR
jgi:hypothetical protein